ncbi:MAG: aspartyl protease family protein [Opitutaceae bacterium]|nr:aspartyl protease family protein [Opitutaceae bacterium]
MKSGHQTVGDNGPQLRRRRTSGDVLARPFLGFLAVAILLLISGGCASIRREPPRPGRTRLEAPLVVLPAQNIGNYLLIEARWDRNGPYRFMIDTGSSVTLMSPTLVRRYPGREPLSAGARVRVTGADGIVTELPSASLRRMELGEARFDDVPVLVYDPAPLSAHLGVRVDGVLGFPLFRELLLTLDYPGSRVLLQPARTVTPVPGAIIAFNDTRKTPLVPIHLGERSVIALIDSGSDAAFSLNPIGLEPEFAFGPRVGATIGTLAGDRTQQIGRLAEPISIGGHLFDRPIVDLTDELSSIGGAVLKYFVVTFDQERNRVTFFRDSHEPIGAPLRLSAGVSFNKTPAYWRVVGVVPGSSAEAEGVQVGDLVTRINGEPVTRWDLPRYEQLVAGGGEITLTFLLGNNETEKRVRVFELVP